MGGFIIITQNTDINNIDMLHKKQANSYIHEVQNKSEKLRPMPFIILTVDRGPIEP